MIVPEAGRIATPLRKSRSVPGRVAAALATVFPATMGPKADPLTTPEVIKPEWFFYVSFRWLKLFSLTVAVLSTGFIVADSEERTVSQ